MGSVFGSLTGQRPRIMNRKASISIIGDGTVGEASKKYALAERLGKALVEAGYRIVCGGRSGVMEAAAKGATTSPSYTSGDVVGILPVTDTGEANPYIDVVIPTPLGHLRNALVIQSDAVIAIGGGAGTLAELAFAWIYDRRTIAFRVDGWSGELADRRIDDRQRFDDDTDDRVVGVDTVQEALEVLEGWEFE